MKVLGLATFLVITPILGLGLKRVSIFDSPLRNGQLRNFDQASLNSIKQVFATGLYVNILQYVCETDLHTRNITEGCLSQMENVCEDGDLWDLMADAWSKYPYAGMLTATKQDWGAFDQCINILHVPENGSRILGKQCTYGLAIPADISLEEFYLLSYCVPDSCSSEDVARLIAVDPLPPSVIENFVNGEICHTQETNTSLDASSIVVATLFCLFLVIIVASTTYDVYLHKLLRKNKTQILTAFSLFTNIKKLTQTTDQSNGEQILVFHGIKVISMMWIVAGHGGAVFSQIPLTDGEQAEQIEYMRYMQYLATAHLGVDTFFFISGFLLTYGYFKSLADKPVAIQIKAIPGMIIHRYLRITPVVLMFFLYSVYLSKHIGSGPLLTAIDDYLNAPCKRNWWAVFLYIQNYYNPTDICWVHLWYLSADWQLFLISPLILIPMSCYYKRQFKRVMVGLVLVNVAFFVLPILIKVLVPEFDAEDLEYDTHSKLITYFMGVMFGFYFRCRKDEPYIFKRQRNVIMWCLSLLIMFAATTLFHEVNIHKYSHAIKSISEVVVKPFWCLGLAFITYSCVKGYGGVVNWALTAGWVQVVSKLTFCLYIMHMPTIFLWLTMKRTRDHFSDYNLFFYWCGHYIMSLIAAAIWSLSFESPLITIEKVLLGGGRRQDNEKKPAFNKPENHQNGISIVHKPPYEKDGV